MCSGSCLDFSRCPDTRQKSLVQGDTNELSDRDKLRKGSLRFSNANSDSARFTYNKYPSYSNFDVDKQHNRKKDVFRSHQADLGHKQLENGVGRN